MGIELGGLMRTDDGGASFSDHRPQAARDVHCMAWHPSVPGRAYEAGGDGAAWSHDSGRSWDRADAGRDRRYAWPLPSTRPIRTVGSSRLPPVLSRRTGAARRTRRSTAGRALAPGRWSRVRSTPTCTHSRSDTGSSSPVLVTARCFIARTAARAGASWASGPAGSLRSPSSENATARHAPGLRRSSQRDDAARRLAAHARRVPGVTPKLGAVVLREAAGLELVGAS